MLPSVIGGPAGCFCSAMMSAASIDDHRERDRRIGGNHRTVSARVTLVTPTPNYDLFRQAAATFTTRTSERSVCSAVRPQLFKCGCQTTDRTPPRQNAWVGLICLRYLRHSCSLATDKVRNFE